MVNRLLGHHGGKVETMEQGKDLLTRLWTLFFNEIPKVNDALGILGGVPIHVVIYNDQFSIHLHFEDNGESCWLVHGHDVLVPRPKGERVMDFAVRCKTFREAALYVISLAATDRAARILQELDIC